jgi:putative transposase
MRKVPLVSGSYYHIYNRGVNRNPIFFSNKDYLRFYQTALHYNKNTTKYSYKQLNDPVSLGGHQRVEVVAYCLMPNHFHFLVKQQEDFGITEYFRQLINSYVHYINIQYKRVGPLFQGRFKSVYIETDEQLLHLSRYIHLNPLMAGLVNKIEAYRWSSYRSYVKRTSDHLVNNAVVADQFVNSKAYEGFLKDQIDYGRSLERLKDQLYDSND